MEFVLKAFFCPPPFFFLCPFLFSFLVGSRVTSSWHHSSHTELSFPSLHSPMWLPARQGRDMMKCPTAAGPMAALGRGGQDRGTAASGCRRVLVSTGVNPRGGTKKGERPFKAQRPSIKQGLFF